jgi:hypothetical protein
MKHAVKHLHFVGIGGASAPPSGVAPQRCTSERVQRRRHWAELRGVPMLMIRLFGPARSVGMRARRSAAEPPRRGVGAGR